MTEQELNILNRDYNLVSNASVHDENGPIELLQVPFKKKQDNGN